MKKKIADLFCLSSGPAFGFVLFLWVTVTHPELSEVVKEGIFLAIVVLIPVALVTIIKPLRFNVVIIVISVALLLDFLIYVRHIYTRDSILMAVILLLCSVIYTVTIRMVTSKK